MWQAILGFFGLMLLILVWKLTLCLLVSLAGIAAVKYLASNKSGYAPIGGLAAVAGFLGGLAFASDYWSGADGGPEAAAGVAVAYIGWLIAAIFVVSD